MSNKLDDLAIEINSIKENKAYSIVVLESTIEELKKEKRDLCKTNAELRMENIAMKHTIADTSSINKNLENEKSSLLTALQLIQNDYNEVNPREDKTWQNTNRIANTKLREPTGHETNPSSTNETSKQSVIQDSVDCTRTIEEVLNPNIQVSNRFSSLNIDEGNQNDVNTTQNDTIIDHREPVMISKEVNGKSNRKHYTNSKETRQTYHHPPPNVAIVDPPTNKNVYFPPGGKNILRDNDNGACYVALDELRGDAGQSRYNSKKKLTYAEVLKSNNANISSQLISKSSDNPKENCEEMLSNTSTDDFVGVQRKRKKFKSFFVSGISELVKEKQISSYFSRRNVIPSHISVFPSKRKGTIWAKIGIPIASISKVHEKTFWPMYVYCKP